MKNTGRVQILTLGLCALFIAACATIQPRYKYAEDFIAPMEKLSSAVDAQLHNPFAQAPSGNDLLSAAINTNPGFQEAFRDATLSITNQDGKAIILMVSLTNANIAWLEYASWTNGLYRFHYTNNPPSRANFTLEFPPRR